MNAPAVMDLWDDVETSVDIRSVEEISQPLSFYHCFATDMNKRVECKDMAARQSSPPPGPEFPSRNLSDSLQFLRFSSWSHFGRFSCDLMFDGVYLGWPTVR